MLTAHGFMQKPWSIYSTDETQQRMKDAQDTVVGVLGEQTASRLMALHAVCRLSRYLNEPTNIHMTQAKRVLIYLYTTKK